MIYLQVIAKSAQELSSPVIADSNSKKSTMPNDSLNMGYQKRLKIPDWQQIVNDRIKLKTRRFARVSNITYSYFSICSAHAIM